MSDDCPSLDVTMGANIKASPDIHWSTWDTCSKALATNHKSAAAHCVDDRKIQGEFHEQRARDGQPSVELLVRQAVEVRQQLVAQLQRAAHGIRLVLRVQEGEVREVAAG